MLSDQESRGWKGLALRASRMVQLHTIQILPVIRLSQRFYIVGFVRNVTQFDGGYWPFGVCSGVPSAMASLAKKGRESG